MPNNNWQRYSNCGRMKSLYSLAALLLIMFFYSTNGQKGGRYFVTCILNMKMTVNSKTKLIQKNLSLRLYLLFIS